MVFGLGRQQGLKDQPSPLADLSARGVSGQDLALRGPALGGLALGCALRSIAAECVAPGAARLRGAALWGAGVGCRSGAQEWLGSLNGRAWGPLRPIGAAAGAFLNAFLPMKRLTFFLCGPRKQRWRGAPQSC